MAAKRRYKLRQEKRNKELEEARKKSEAEEQERQRQLEKFKEELAKRQITSAHASILWRSRTGFRNFRSPIAFSALRYGRRLIPAG